MANTFTETRRRLPASGDLNWDDETNENFEISDVTYLSLKGNDRTISGGVISAGSGLTLNYTTWKGVINETVYNPSGSSLSLTAGPAGGRLLNWVYVNSSGTVVSSTTRPTGNFALLGTADTDDTTILGVADLRVLNPVSRRFDAGTDINEFSTDGTMAGNSDDVVPTEKAVVTYTQTERRVNRNLLINGDCAIAQRATSVTGKTTSGYYTVDRLRATIISAGTWGLARSATVYPDGFAYSHKFDCEVSQASLPASAALFQEQKIEGQFLQHLKKGLSGAKPLSFQFWVRSAKTGTYIIEIIDNDNSRHIASSYTISSADTWEKKTVTFPGDTTGSFDADANSSLRVLWWLAAGTDYSSGTLATSWAASVNANRAVGQINLADSTDNDWYCTGFQLEEGSYHTDFEVIPEGENLTRCSRYYHQGDVNFAASNAFTTTAVANSFVAFPAVMRVTPTSVTVSSVSLQASLGTYSSLTSARATRFGMSPQFAVSGATAGYAGYATYDYSASAEL